MKFSNRIKKELTEGVVRAILIDAGYRLIECGIEKVFREIECLTRDEYLDLAFPQTMRKLPDFAVMDKEQKQKYIVEVKYRAKWDTSIFDEIKEQVQLYDELVLIYFNADPKQAKPNITNQPSTHIRCCRVKCVDEDVMVYYREKDKHHNDWVKSQDINDSGFSWWGLDVLQNIFPLINEKKEEGTLFDAIESLQGIVKKQT